MLKTINLFFIFSLFIGCTQPQTKTVILDKQIIKEILPKWIKNPNFNDKIASIGRCRPTANDNNQMEFAIDRALITLGKTSVNIKISSNSTLIKNSNNSVINEIYKSNTNSEIFSNREIKAKLTHIFYDKNNMLYVRLEKI